MTPEEEKQFDEAHILHMSTNNPDEPIWVSRPDVLAFIRVNFVSRARLEKEAATINECLEEIWRIEYNRKKAHEGADVDDNSVKSWAQVAQRHLDDLLASLTKKDE